VLIAQGLESVAPRGNDAVRQPGRFVSAAGLETCPVREACKLAGVGAPEVLAQVFRGGYAQPVDCPRRCTPFGSVGMSVSKISRGVDAGTYTGH
jgi:hypothetical protein